MTVHCWDCPAISEIPSDMEGQAFREGKIQRRIAGDTNSWWMGVCGNCQVAHARADDPRATITRRLRSTLLDHVQGETRQILLYARELCENDLALALDEAIHRAVDVLYAPERERHSAFREYLISRRETQSAA